VTVPVNCLFLDNASKDRTLDLLHKHLADFPFPSQVLDSRRNLGFAAGVNLLSVQCSSDLMFLLNPDAILEPGCVETLARKCLSDPEIGMCEARQIPREHPKTYHSKTGETSWCTGAAVMVRRKVFEELGRFDERIFFMYCEDVDLSWKFWLAGWKCIYVPEAVIQHYSQDLVPGKRRTLENYFTFRNSLFLFYRFGSWRQKQVLFHFLISRFVSGHYTWKSRILFALAFVEHLRYIPYLVRTRNPARGQQHPWVRLDETSLAH
jgi:GT2 family glycosyltransferase